MKCFIFDLGGVIVMPMQIEKIYESFTWNISYESFKEKFTLSKEAIDLHEGLITTEEYFCFIKKFIRDNISFIDFIEAYKKSKQNPYEDTIEIIKQLKKQGYKVHLLSNLREIDFKLYQEKFDTTIFDKLFLSYELNLTKPKKEIYEYVITNLNTYPEKIYFFDDSIDNVEAAKNCKINAYQVTGENIKKLFKTKFKNIIN